VEVTERNWVQRLLAHAGLPGVGAVAPTLTQPDGRVDEAGLAIGLYDPVVAAMRGFPADSDGYYGSLSCAREVSALGMDCLLIRRTDFDRVGGFEEAYSRQHQAHDLCMRLAKLGLSCVCAPGPLTITHSTEAQRLADFDVADRALFVERFYERLQAGDPYYNRGFFRAAADYALPPFGGDPREIALRETVA
jgi:GT2 family glycosyltransferase